VFGDWIEEMCDADPGNEFKVETVAALFENWVGYIKKLGGEPGTKNSFSDRLEAKGFTRAKTRAGRLFRGIRLRPAPDYHG
jgi:putative DNA primase/helicase